MWVFNPFTGRFDWTDSLFTVTEYNADKALVIGDMKQVHSMDVAGGEQAFWLPEVVADNVGDWIILVKKGAANLLRVWAGGSDIVLNSSAGGYIECAEARTYANIYLLVIAAGYWTSIGSFGIWSSH